MENSSAKRLKLDHVIQNQIHICKERISSQTMETFFLRFPHLTEKVFDYLYDEELKECKEVSREWYSYLSQQKFLQIRMI